MIQISFFCHAFRNGSERFKAECQTHLRDDVIFSLTLGILRLMTQNRKQSETLKVQVKTLKKHFFLKFFGIYYHRSPLPLAFAMAMPKAAGYEAWRIIQYEDDVSVWMRRNSFANPPLYQHTLDLPPTHLQSLPGSLHF